jgi:tetratricopeptide (TPR) repeat protein
MPSKRKPQAPQRGFSKSTHLLLIVVLAFLTYSNALRGGFVWDDELQIVKNWQIRGLSYIPSAFSSAFWTFADPEAGAHTNFYRPVQTLSYIAAFQIGGLAPWPFHLINILLHILASALVYLICVELQISPAAAAIGAGIFATHPVHTETVAWAAGTPDASCAVFYFLSLLLWLRFMWTTQQKWRWMSAASFLVALFSKEMAVTLPAIVVLIMFKEGRVKSLKKTAVDVAPLLFAGVIYMSARLMALGFISTTHLNIQASFLDWATLALRVFGQYIQYALIPYPLSAYHLIALHFTDRILSTVLYVFLIVIAAYAAFSLDRRIRGIGLWAIAFAVMLIPVFNFTGISLTFFAERYLYIPSLAVSIIVGLILSRFGRNAMIPMMGVIAAFGIYSFARNRDWSSDEKLYASILRVQPEVAHIRNNLADIYIKAGQDDLAKANLEASLKSLASTTYLQADNEKYRAEVGLGALAARHQQYAEAKDHLNEALKINPRGDWAYLYLGGVVMEGEGNYELAMQLFRKAMDLGPVNEVARDYMGVALFNLKRYKEAVPYFQEALKINPTYKDAQAHLDMVSRVPAS